MALERNRAKAVGKEKGGRGIPAARWREGYSLSGDFEKASCSKMKV
jgi:hypothetical protein